MRPKKRILLIDSDEMRASVTRFTLTQLGFAVDSEAAIPLGAAYTAPDVVLAYFPIDAADAWRVADSWIVQFLFVCQKEEEYPHHLVHPSGYLGTLHVVVKPLTWDLVDRLKSLTARKRGPRKGWNTVQPAEVEVCA